MSRAARVEPKRSLRRLRRERLVIGDDGRSRGQVARGSRAPRLRYVDADFRLLTLRPQRTGREGREFLICNFELGKGFKVEDSIVLTLVGALPTDGFEV